MALDVIRERFVGKWKYFDGTNFDDLLRELGVGVVVRKLACLASPLETVSVKDDVISIVNHYHWSVKDQVFSFRLGEEFIQDVEGNKMKVVVSVEGEKIKMELHPVDPACKVKPQVSYREVVGNELHLTVHIGDVVCTRKFKRQ